MRNRLTVKFMVFFSLVLLLGAYFLFEARGYLKGPKIILETPRAAEVVRDSYIQIKGRAFNIASLFLNGRHIFIDDKGAFDERLLLAKGYNIIEITAVDKFGRVKKEQREVVLE